MTTAREKYLLRNQSRIDAFKKIHRTELRQYAGAYRRWIRSLPYMEWVLLQLRPEEEEIVIGIICVLHCDRHVCISFSNDMRCIRNEPLDQKEMLTLMKDTGWHGPEIDRIENEKLR